MRGLLGLFLLVIPLIPLAIVTQAPVALASSDWCDTDPILVIHTPAGNLVPVYVTVGAHSPLFTPNTLLGSLVPSYTAVPTSNGAATSVRVVVTVPPLPLDPSFATRDTVSTGVMGTGIVYAQASGVSGNAMTSTFQLPYP